VRVRSAALDGLGLLREPVAGRLAAATRARADLDGTDQRIEMEMRIEISEIYKYISDIHMYLYSYPDEYFILFYYY